MDESRVTRQLLEILESQTISARMTRGAVEVIGKPRPSARVTRVYAEVLWKPKPVVDWNSSVGFGQLAFGRHKTGGVSSDIESRFELSNPEDGSTGVSVHKTVVSFDVYSYSSRLIFSTMLLEVSENGGDSYVDGYDNDAFVSPFDGPRSRVDRIDGQRMRIYIEKDGAWTSDSQIRVRVTVKDNFGATTTKEIPIEWE